MISESTQLALHDRLAAHKRFSQANYRHGKQGIYGITPIDPAKMAQELVFCAARDDKRPLPAAIQFFYLIFQYGKLSITLDRRGGRCRR